MLFSTSEIQKNESEKGGQNLRKISLFKVAVNLGELLVKNISDAAARKETVTTLSDWLDALYKATYVSIRGGRKGEGLDSVSEENTSEPTFEDSEYEKTDENFKEKDTTKSTPNAIDVQDTETLYGLWTLNGERETKTNCPTCPALHAISRTYKIPVGNYPVPRTGATECKTWCGCLLQGLSSDEWDDIVLGTSVNDVTLVSENMNPDEFVVFTANLLEKLIGGDFNENI